jgi:hypothetical protein
MPVLFDVVQTRRAFGFATNHWPAGWNIGEGRPQAVLLLVVDQEEKAPIVVVERIDAHQLSRPSSRDEQTFEQTLLEANRVGGGFDKIPDLTYRPSPDT